MATQKVSILFFFILIGRSLNKPFFSISEHYENTSLDSLLDANHFVEHPHHRGGGILHNVHPSHSHHPMYAPHHNMRQNHPLSITPPSHAPLPPQSTTLNPEGGVSLTNLSHDSGLTTSDSQLYAFEDGGNQSFSDEDYSIENRQLAAAANKMNTHLSNR